LVRNQICTTCERPFAEPFLDAFGASSKRRLPPPFMSDIWRW
jgi:hypothetical protein